MAVVVDNNNPVDLVQQTGGVVVNKEPVDRSEQLQKLALLYPALRDLQQVGRPVADPLADPLVKELERTLLTQLAQEHQVPLKEVEKAKISIFRLVAQVFGKESMDLHAMIQMVGAFGMQIETDRLVKVQAELEKLDLQLQSKKHVGSMGGLVAGLIGAVGIVISVAAFKFVGPAGAAGAIKLSTALAISVGAMGASAGLIVAGTVPKKSFLALDSGINQTDLMKTQNKQTLLTNEGQLIQQALQAVMTTQTSRSAQETQTLVEIFRNMLQTQQRVQSTRG